MKKFDNYDSDSRVLADIRELLYILVNFSNPETGSQPRLLKFESDHMEDK